MKAFPEIKLDLLIDYVVDNRGKNPAYYCDEGIPVIDNFQITGKRHINLKESKRFIDEKVYDEFLRKYLIENDLLLTLVGNGYGSVSLAPKQKSVIIQNTIGIRCNEKCLNEFLFYYFSKNKHKILELNRGAAQPSVKVSDVKGILVSLPPLTQQKTIVSILSNYDELIFNNEQRIKILEEMAQAIYTEWFVNFRFPGHENVKLVDSKTDFGEIPEGWTVEKMLDVGQVITGKTPSKLIESNFGHEVPFIKTPDLHGNIFCIKTSEYLSEKGANSQKKKTLPRNTLIVSCIGTLGVVSITTKESQTNQQINALVPNDDTFLEYGYFLLKGMKKQLQNLGSNGATMGNVNKGKFENIKVILPSKANLNEFNQVTSTMFQLIENLQKQNLYLTQTRDLLIPKLVTGEIEIKA
jgi:type I restriction enzyme S subunit